MQDALQILSAAALIAVFSVIAYGHARTCLRARVRNQVLRSIPPWKRDDWNVRSWHQEMIMKLYDVKPEDRPIIISILKTENGDGSLACSHPKGWPEGSRGYNYAQGTGLEILRTIAGAVALMESAGNKNCLNTLLILLEEERERLNNTRTNNQLP